PRPAHRARSQSTGPVKKAPLLLAGPSCHAARAAGWYPAPAHIPNSGRWNWFHDDGSRAVIPGRAGTGLAVPEPRKGRGSQASTRLVVMSSTRHITNIKTRGPAHCTAQVRRRPIRPFPISGRRHSAFGQAQTEGMLNLQKELLETYEQASRAWLDR